MKCLIPECQNQSDSTRPSHMGYCSKHYARWYTYGDPRFTLRVERELAEEFIQKAIKWKLKTKCLIWPFIRDPSGYALKGKHRVSRIVCCAVNGKAPKTKPFALHSCGNGHLGCINPYHLYWGDEDDNHQDALEHGTMGGGELSPSPKLTVLEVEQIRREYATGKTTHRELGEKYGVVRATITHIIGRKTWK